MANMEPQSFYDSIYYCTVHSAKHLFMNSNQHYAMFGDSHSEMEKDAKEEGETEQKRKRTKSPLQCNVNKNLTTVALLSFI